MIPIRDQPDKIQIALQGSHSPIRLDLVYLVYLVCFVIWLNDTNQINQTNKINESS